MSLPAYLPAYDRPIEAGGLRFTLKSDAWSTANLPGAAAEVLEIHLADVVESLAVAGMLRADLIHIHRDAYAEAKQTFARETLSATNKWPKMAQWKLQAMLEESEAWVAAKRGLGQIEAAQAAVDAHIAALQAKLTALKCMIENPALPGAHSG
jgi:hypothetical protein